MTQQRELIKLVEEYGRANAKFGNGFGAEAANEAVALLAEIRQRLASVAVVPDGWKPVALARSRIEAALANKDHCDKYGWIHISVDDAKALLTASPTITPERLSEMQANEYIARLEYNAAYALKVLEDRDRHAGDIPNAIDGLRFALPEEKRWGPLSAAIAAQEGGE